MVRTDKSNRQKRANINTQFLSINWLKANLSHVMRLWYFFVRHKLILQTGMHSHPVGLDVWCLVPPFIYFHILCVWIAKALARLCKCAGSPEPSLVTYVISTVLSWAGSFIFLLNIWHCYGILPILSFSSPRPSTVRSLFSLRGLPVTTE